MAIFFTVALVDRLNQRDKTNKPLVAQAKYISIMRSYILYDARLQ